MISYRPGAIDLRSDQLTKPSPAMLEVMVRAPVGNDIYGEDPSVIELESEVADLLGMEAAMYTPSGTMANQIAIAMWTRPGDSVLVEKDSHCYLLESGAPAIVANVQMDSHPIGTFLDLDVVNRVTRPDGLVFSPSTLAVVENTHNMGAGQVYDRQQMQKIRSNLATKGLKIHCDGARIWNAAVATGDQEKDLLAGFDSVSVCFSKGLGAPVGSALAGPKDFIERARKWKKRLGGGMCQAGLLAAAATYAIRNHRQDLIRDHQRLGAFKEFFSNASVSNLEVQCPEVHTNILYWRICGTDGQQLAEKLADAGVLMHHMGDGWLRIVTYRDLSDDDVERAIKIIGKTID